MIRLWVSGKKYPFLVVYAESFYRIVVDAFKFEKGVF
jgi:hypothetical protein